MSIPAARARLLRHLRSLRLPDGSFTTFISSDKGLTGGTQSCRSNFFLGLTLSSLYASGLDETGQIRHGLIDVLRRDAGPHGAFNYWMRSEPLRTVRPYPDDLDTTFCVMAALCLGEGEDGRSALLGSAVRLLTSVEIREGGPYRTWLMPADADPVWQDVDIAVNANVAYYLSLNGIRLESLDGWLYEQIRAGTYESPYYPSPIPLLYFLARGYRGPLQEKLSADILSARQQDGTWGNITHTALALAALGRLNGSEDMLLEERKKLAHAILETDAPQAHAFCIDSITSMQQWYAGSPALTTAVCLEALGAAEPSSQPTVRAMFVADEEKVFRAVKDVLRVRFSRIADPLGRRLQEWSDRILTGERGREIPLLPFRFHESFVAQSLSSDRLIALGAANCYGWIAYTIYDDLLDEEGDIEHLSVANVCLRAVDAVYAEMGHECPPVARLYEEVMDGIDRANAWELEKTRLRKREGTYSFSVDVPDYGDHTVLAERSFGHALGPLTILCMAGCSPASREMQNALDFFRHAFIARQLDDDAHDWEEDLCAGRVNAVAALLLRAWREQGGRLEGPCSDQLVTLREFFWQHVIENVTGLMLHHVHAAESSLEQMAFVRDRSPLRELLAPTRRSAEQARHGARGTRAFIASYRADS